MLIGDLFRFESKAKKEKKHKKYSTRLYPFGIVQQDKDRQILKEFFGDARDTDELMFLLISLREGLLNSQLDEDEEEYVTREFAITNWERNPTAAGLNEWEKSIFITLADMDNAATCVEDLPSKEAVMNAVNDLDKMHK